MLAKPGKRPLIPAHRALQASGLYLNPKAQCRKTPTYPCKRAPTNTQIHKHTPLHTASLLFASSPPIPPESCIRSPINSSLAPTFYRLCRLVNSSSRPSSLEPPRRRRGCAILHPLILITKAAPFSRLEGEHEKMYICLE
jgi:hypothetical protein